MSCYVMVWSGALHRRVKAGKVAGRVVAVIDSPAPRPRTT